jgi:type IV pilus assembly protein PilV
MECMAMKRGNRGERGFTLIEVLIAILVFSIGLIGLAGMMVVSVKTNHSAYLRTQAGHLAQAMADRIRSNLGQVNAYIGVYDPNTPPTNPCAAASIACPPAAIVTRDLSVWLGQVDALLPNAQAEIACNGASLGFGAQIGAAPYDGQCTIWLRWDESSLREAATTPDRQEFAWVFQP